MKAKKKVNKVRLSEIDKKTLLVGLKERKRIGERKVKQYRLNYMR